MTGNGNIVEVQATAEKDPFSEEQLLALLALARKGIGKLSTCKRWRGVVLLLHLSIGRGRIAERDPGEGYALERLRPPHPNPLQSKSDIFDFDQS